MKFSQKKKREVTSILIFTLVLASVSAFSDSATAEGTEEAARFSEGLTAGVSDVWNSDNVHASALTAGVAEITTDVNPVVVADTDAETVAEGQEDSTFCGYTNLGMASVDGNLNVRSGPSTDYSIVGKMTNHAACEIVGTEGDWTQIVSGDVSGYVSSEYLITGDEALQIAQEEVQTVATVHTTTLRVREEASTESSIISLVGDGEDLVVTEELDGWVKVEVDDLEGYVSDEYVDLSLKLTTAMTLAQLRYGEGVSDVRVSLVEYALQFVGNKYVWGGTSLTNGVDCSGFTMQVYAHFGISLPHSSKAQAGYGTKISASEAQPGDLFFYGSGSSISHVAIYIGNGQVVHASNKRDGIKISSCYYRTPIKVVRILD